MNPRMEPSRMDLRAATLCMELDCNTIFDSAMYRHCPTCGSVESYPLESWLNRERLPKTGGARQVSRPDVGSAPGAPWLARLRGDSNPRLAAPLRKLSARALRRRAG
ncbi:MAG TPA: hypothetical protein VLK35_13145 [Methylomirabilota bacterium]|nr:hypothetical protein [Methylomirabilota bacterium]